MTTERTRVPAGVRTGGQFTTHTRGEAAVDLAILSPEVAQAVRADIAALHQAAQSNLEVAREAAEGARLSLLEAEDALEGAKGAYEQARRAHEQTSGELERAQRTAAALQTTVQECATPPTPAMPHDPTRVLDVVEVDGYGRFTRITPDSPLDADLGYLRVQVDRDLTTDEATRQLAALVGYRWAAVGGEPIAQVHQDSPNSIIVYADATKTRSFERVAAFLTEVGDTIREGSPVRVTDRSGPGTLGTRLVSPLAGVGTVTLYQEVTS
ncbi:hypothetical protein CHO01_39460 [Cellulomonas hominis]|uniref:Uncharacterized protein n=1 Tax=Cellulomonas hominis TaxID=156981 RepID=A0A511FHY5_9CELL|nr:hypothetical protein [Cellulomonas hominis]MBB5474644.1 hypothetical protein [Cellulomonas hominis]NKY05998.1 hypothetical protein [Cellulomonas hominis]GEL48830.1 hypothetical protein CHO01_39460 [Cellulomonas hominis]